MYNSIKNFVARFRFGKFAINKLYGSWQMIRFVFRIVCCRGYVKPVDMRCSEEFRDGPKKLVSFLPENSIMVEVGSYRGESAQLFLESGKISKIYCIDPWKPFYDNTDSASFTDMKQVESDFDKRFANDKRVVKVKGTIDDFAPRREDPEIDFVYIDGCHTYEATMHDIQVAMSVIRPKRAIAGHDWAWQGVQKAVTEQLGSPDKIFPDTSWLKYLS